MELMRILACLILLQTSSPNPASSTPSIQPECRHEWQGRKLWEGMSILGTDRNYHIWFLLYPEKAFVVPDRKFVGKGDDRGSSLIQYDGNSWWQYPLHWRNLPLQLRLHYPLSQFNSPSRDQVIFGTEFSSNTEGSPSTFQSLRIQKGCLQASVKGTVTPESLDLPMGNEKDLASTPPGMTDEMTGFPMSERIRFWTGNSEKAWAISAPVSNTNRSTFLYRFDGKHWHLATRIHPESDRGEIWNFVMDSTGAVWIIYYGNLIERYRQDQVCSWQVPENLYHGHAYSGPNGQVWLQSSLPVRGTWPLQKRYSELPKYQVYDPTYPLEEIIGDFVRDFPSEYWESVAGTIKGETAKVMTPFFFDGKIWRYAAVPPKEPLLNYEKLEKINETMQCSSF